MQEEWRKISEFPSYAVSDSGLVLNESSGRLMALHTNQRGIVNVSFNKGGVQYKRSVALLVATAFLKAARSLSFDTPINLDGDRENNHASNLMWRPRWYAVKYFRQFQSPERIPSIDKPIQEFKTEEIFETSWIAATCFGLLNEEVVKSVTGRTYAWPTYQRFRIYR